MADSEDSAVTQKLRAILKWANVAAAGTVVLATLLAVGNNLLNRRRNDHKLKLIDDLFELAEKGQEAAFIAALDEWKSSQFGQMANIRSPLHAAAFKGHAKIVDIILDSGICDVDIEFGDPSIPINGITPFLLSAEAGRFESLKVLHKRGANVNAVMTSGQSALIGAVYAKSFDCVKYLLGIPGINLNSKMVTDGATALHLAVTNKSVDILTELLKHKGIDLDAPRATDTQKGCTALHFASDFGHMEMVKALIEAGATVDAQTSDLITPFSCAARNSHLDICKYLIDAGANPALPNYDGTVPLHFAVINKQLDFVNMLIAQPGVDVNAPRSSMETTGVTPLHLASEIGALEIAKVLIQNGADVNAKFNTGQTPLMSAVWKGNLDIAKLLIEHGADVKAAVTVGTTALMLAAEALRDDIVEELLKAGAPILPASEDGSNALTLSCVESPNATKIVKLLLAQPDGTELVRKEIIHSKRGMIGTALHFCAQNNCLDIAKLLLEHNPVVDAKLINGETPLFTACHHGHTEVAVLLLDHDANVNATLTNGVSVLMASIRNNNTNLVKTLLDRKADLSARDDNGYTPLHYAYIYKSLPIIGELETRGADVNAQSNAGLKPHEVAKKNPPVVSN